MNEKNQKGIDLCGIDSERKKIITEVIEKRAAKKIDYEKQQT